MKKFKLILLMLSIQSLFVKCTNDNKYAAYFVDEVVGEKQLLPTDIETEIVNGFVFARQKGGLRYTSCASEKDILSNRKNAISLVELKETEDFFNLINVIDSIKSNGEYVGKIWFNNYPIAIQVMIFSSDKRMLRSEEYRRKGKHWKFNKVLKLY